MFERDDSHMYEQFVDDTPKVDKIVIAGIGLGNQKRPIIVRLSCRWRRPLENGNRLRVLGQAAAVPATRWARLQPPISFGLREKKIHIHIVPRPRRVRVSSPNTVSVSRPGAHSSTNSLNRV
jgi:hypothetical protein